MYTIKFTENARKQLVVLAKRAPGAMKKLAKLLEELREHLRTGTGQVKQLKHYQEETWSRRNTREHRLVYRINDNTVEVLVLAVFGHYED